LKADLSSCLYHHIGFGFSGGDFDRESSRTESKEKENKEVEQK